MKNVLKTIKALRNSKGYSYDNMAEELNISSSAYRKIEKNETRLTVERLFQIANILNTPVQLILGINESVTHSHENINQEDEIGKRIKLLEDEIKLLKHEVILTHHLVPKNND